MLPEQTFRTWLTSTEAVALSDDTLVVAAPTRFAVEWIEDKYGSLLRDLARRELGRPVHIQFEHSGSTDRLQFPELSGTDEAGPGSHADRPVTRPESRKPELTDDEAARASGLNPRYSFERFVVGANSQLAAAACRGVADSPAQVYNPLFIYGDTGLGKTHLMHAVGHAILSKN
ncbi:MAG: DnaA ATPase domain-containing protein, partial [Gemmatimonadota bacterium]